jgi:DNA-binding response OmpR family regulator
MSLAEIAVPRVPYFDVAAPLPPVLIVEDERRLQWSLIDQFRALGMEARSAATGHEAIRVAGESRPELILLDGLLPEMDGFEIARFIRRIDADYRPHIAIMRAIYKQTRYRNEAAEVRHRRLPHQPSAAAVAGGTGAAASGGGAMNAVPKPRGRVLIVDDEPDLLEGMKMLLDLEGIDVILHGSMITLPLILRDADPDVVLLDVSLPALSVTAASHSDLRKLLRTDAALVLFSGRSQNELTKLTQALGGDGFILKSDDPMDIVGRIQTWIDRRRLKRYDRSEGPNAANRTAPAIAR